MKTAAEATKFVKDYAAPRLDELFREGGAEQVIAALDDILVELVGHGLDQMEREPWEAFSFISFASFMAKNALNDSASLAVLQAMQDIVLSNLLKKVGTIGLHEGMADIQAFQILMQIRMKPKA